MTPSLIKNKNSLIILVPAILAFLIALIPTLKYQYPLSWDIFYHVHLAKLYLENGFTFWDPLTCFPSGRPIEYPPLFHLLLAGLSSLFNTSPFNVARALQPIFAFSLVLSISFVTRRFYGLTAGVSAGLMVIYSFITFNRSMIVSPGTLGLIIMPLAIYAYYLALEKSNYKFLILSGVLSAITFLTHSLSGFCLLLVLLVYTVAIRVSGRNTNLRYLGIYLLITLLLSLIWWGPLYLLYKPEYSVFPGPHLPVIYYYLRYLGILPTLLAIVGFLFLLERKENRDILVIIWAFSILLVSQIYIIGIEVIPIRFMEIASYPMVIIAGVGLVCAINRLSKSLKNWDKRKLTCTILLLFAIFTTVSGAVFVDGYTTNLAEDNETYLFPHEVHLIFNPLDHWAKFAVISDRFLDLNLARDRKEVADWFTINGEKNVAVFSQDSYMDTIIVSTSRLGVLKGGYSEGIPSSIRTQDTRNLDGLESYLKANGFKYLLIKKGNNVPSYARTVFENGHYIICVVE
jgi:hypothetical protein